MHIFFAEITNRLAKLNEAESRHCVKVLRHALGDVIWVMNGNGIAHEACITELTSSCVRAKLNDRVYQGPSVLPLRVFFAPTKHMDRTEWAIEKAVELGVKEIGFLSTRYSERRNLNFKRLESIVDTALKQSLRTLRPQLSEWQSLDTLLQKFGSKSLGMAHCQKGTKTLLKHWIDEPITEYTVCIGPEGDFSEQEITMARSKGCTELNLGNARLRTETAVVHTCSVFWGLIN